MAVHLPTSGPRFDFSITDKLHFDSRPYTFLQSLEEGASFRNMDGSGLVEYFTYEHVATLMSHKGRYRNQVGFYSAASQRLFAQGKDVLISDLDDAPRELVLYKTAFVLAYRKILADISHDPTDADRLAAIDLVHRELVDRLANTKSTLQVTVRKKPPLTTVKGWDNELAAHDDKPAALIDNRPTRSGNRSERFEDAVLELIDLAIRGYLDERRPTMDDQYNLLKAMVYQANKERLAHGLPALTTPCKTALTDRITRIDEYLKHAMRHGIDEAEKKYRATGTGMTIVRPGRRSEIDGWEVELHTLLAGTDAWKDLSKEERKKAKTWRLIVIVIIDCATRCITGIHFSLTETAAAAIAAMRLSVGNKDELARLLGCNSAWPMYSAGTLTSDNGPAFIDELAAAIALDAFGGVGRSVVGVPWLRGRIERFFRTMSRQLLQHFTGRTFGNIGEKGEYDAVGRASITMEELRNALLRWVVDVYHHTRHRELGMTPFMAWHLLEEKSPPPPPMDRGRIAAIFGTRLVRHIYGEGVVFSNQHYNSPELQRAMRRSGIGTEVRVKIDPDDLGEIAVEVPVDKDGRVDGELPTRKGWISVPGPEELRGVTLWQFRAAAEALKVRYGDLNAESEEIRNAAIAELRALGDRAAELRLSHTSPSADETEELANFAFPRFVGGSPVTPEPDRKRRKKVTAPDPDLVAKTKSGFFPGMAGQNTPPSADELAELNDVKTIDATYRDKSTDNASEAVEEQIVVTSSLGVRE